MMCFKIRLSSIQEQQEKNIHALKEHKRVEEQLGTLDQRKMRLFEWLHDVWGRDKELIVSLENDRLALQHEQQKTARKLHDEKQVLKHEKSKLLNAEEHELSTLRRTLMQEEKL